MTGEAPGAHVPLVTPAGVFLPDTRRAVTEVLSAWPRMRGLLMPTIGAWFIDGLRGSRLRLTPKGHGAIVGPLAASDIRICRKSL